MSSEKPDNHRQLLRRALKIALLILLAPLILVTLVPYLLYGAALLALIWLRWCRAGRCVLVVYSNSPVWKPWFEEELLPRLRDAAVILNWSERAQWERRASLAVLAFHYFGGRREFNPLAVVFRPWQLPQTFRFYRPFRDYKHGKPEAVEALARRLLDAVRQAHRTDNTPS